MVKRQILRGMALVCAAVATMSLAACGGGSRGGPIPYDVANFKAPDAPKPAAIAADAPITSGDTLAVTVFQVESLSRDYVVDQTGGIDMPLIGSVKVASLTTNQARALIARRLSEKYLQNPDVTVTLKSSTSRNVTVDGSVRQPGIDPVTANLTLIEEVAMARGTDDQANPRRVAIFRTVDGQRMAAAFDLTSIRRGEMANPVVYPGDIVVVDGHGKNNTFQNLLQTLPLLALFRPY